MEKNKIQDFKESLRKKIGLDRWTTLKVMICRFYCRCKSTDKRLLELKDKHKGERCFIVATGPSLTVDDLNKIKGEISFSLNSIVKLFDKTDWRPDYYVISDPDVYASIGEEINQADLRTVLYNDFDILNFARTGIPYKGTSEYMIKMCSRNPKKHPKQILFSTNAAKGFYTWHTTLGTILQIAAYMGFSEIYLLGTDCNYQKGSYHAEGIDYKCELLPNAGESIIRDYEMAVPVLKNIHVRVYNATRGGALEVFPRVNLDELLKNK